MATMSKGTSAFIVECATCEARPDGLCKAYAPDALDVLASYKSGDREIQAGQDLFRLGETCDAVFNLVDGWVFLYNLLKDGRRQILHFALPGAVLGYHLMGGVRATFGAQALTRATICSISHESLERLSKDHSGIGMRLAWLISRDHSLSYDHLTSVGRRTSRERVAHLLLELFIRYRSQWPGHRIENMHLPLTQEHIGDAIGMTGVHANRVLRELLNDGILEFHYRRLTILDPDRLVDVAGIDPQLAQSWITGPPKK